MVKVNCGALPAGLVESELFGHEKGAFTGATAQKKGRFELAHRGTIFLDEVGELPLETQVKLLRVLQEQEFERVGGAQTLQVNARVIAATNRNLQEQVQRGAFRADLFYRLNIFPIQVPPLRERHQDIPLLANFLVREFARRLGKRIHSIHQKALDKLTGYAWPGNVRELENLLHREFLMGDGPAIHLSSITGAGAPAPAAAAACLTESSFQDAKASAIACFERAYILELLARTRGNISQAARISGKERSRLGKMVKKYGLERASFGGDAG
jgi:Nif-specific regulatory protein